MRQPSPMTAQSIQDALDAQQRERQHVTATTGIAFTANGRMVARRPAFIVCCPKCCFEASARSEGRALNAIANHLITVHHQPVPESHAA